MEPEKFELYPIGTSWSQRARFTWVYIAFLLVKLFGVRFQYKETELQIGIGPFLGSLTRHNFPHTSQGALLYIFSRLQSRVCEPNLEELNSGAFSYTSLRSPQAKIAVLFPSTYPLVSCLAQLSSDSPSDLKCLALKSDRLEAVAVPAGQGWSLHFIGGVIQCRNWDEFLLACGELSLTPNFAVYWNNQEFGRQAGQVSEEAKQFLKTQSQQKRQVVDSAQSRVSAIDKTSSSSQVEANLQEMQTQPSSVESVPVAGLPIRKVEQGHGEAVHSGTEPVECDLSYLQVMPQEPAVRQPSMEIETISLDWYISPQTRRVD